MNREELIEHLREEIAKRDARIVELEAGDNTELLKAYMNAEAEKGIELVKLRAELAELRVTCGAVQQETK